MWLFPYGVDIKCMWKNREPGKYVKIIPNQKLKMYGGN